MEDSKKSVWQNFLSPVHGKLLCQKEYVPVGNNNGVAWDAPDLIDIKLDLAHARKKFNDVVKTSFIVASANNMLPNAQALDELNNGFMKNIDGVIETASSILPSELTITNGRLLTGAKVGAIDNVGVEIEKLPYDNLPDVPYENVIVGNFSGRPEAKSQIPFSALPDHVPYGIITYDITGKASSSITASTNYVRGPTIPASIEGNLAVWAAAVPWLAGGRDITDSGVSLLSVEGLFERVSTLETKVTTLEGQVESIEGRLDAVEGDITAINIDLTELNVQVDLMALDLAALNLEVTGLSADVGVLNTTVGGLSAAVAVIQGQIISINSRISSLETTVSSHAIAITAINTMLSSFSITQYGLLVGAPSGGINTLAPVVTNNNILVSQGAFANPAWSNITIPSTTTANNLIFSSSNNTLGEITAVANCVLTTNVSSIPSFNNTLPLQVQNNITQLTNVAVSSLITVPTPVTGTEATNKNYVDTAISSVLPVSTANTIFISDSSNVKSFSNTLPTDVQANISRYNTSITMLGANQSYSFDSSNQNTTTSLINNFTPVGSSLARNTFSLKTGSTTAFSIQYIRFSGDVTGYGGVDLIFTGTSGTRTPIKMFYASGFSNYEVVVNAVVDFNATVYQYDEYILKTGASTTLNTGSSFTAEFGSTVTIDGTITVPTPTLSAQAANKDYVDTTVASSSAAVLPTSTANTVLISDASNVKSFSSTLPTQVQTNITSLGTVSNGTWNANTISVVKGGTGATDAATARTNLGLTNIATQTVTANAILQGATSNGITSRTLTNGQLLIGSTGAQPTAGLPTNSTNISWTAGAGTLTANLTGLVSLTNGGTNSSITANNGGIVYSNATSLAVLPGTATAGQMLRSGASSAPSWSTVTYPSTTNINRILYSSAANTISEIPPANGAILRTNAAGVPSFATGTSDQFWRGDGLFSNTLTGSLGLGGAVPVTSGSMQFASTTANRKLVLYNVGNNDHQYYGLGVNNATFRYQVSEGGSHIFYSALNSTTSQELARLTANKNLIVGDYNVESSRIVAFGGVENIPGETSCFRAISGNTTLIELQSVAATGRLYEIRSRFDGSLDITDRSGGATRFVIDTAGRVGIGFGSSAGDQLLSVNTANPSKIGAGSWVAYSDSRIKDIDGEYKNGLKEILQITPKIFKYKENSGYKKDELSKKRVGIIAQEIEDILPECIVEKQKKGDIDDLRVFDMTPITYALINAVKELHKELTELKQQRG